MDKISKKDGFLSEMFGFLTHNIQEKRNLSDLIEKTDKIIDNEIIKKEILEHKKLAEDAILEYIFVNILRINLSHKIDDKFLKINVKIENSSQYIFQDFTYEVSWKPKNRIQQIAMEEVTKSRDLHIEVSRNYSFTIENVGNITLFLLISFLNLFYPEKTIKRVIKIDKIDFRLFSPS